VFELKDIRKRYLENKIVGKDFGENCEVWGVSDEINVRRKTEWCLKGKGHTRQGMSEIAGENAIDCW